MVPKEVLMRSGIISLTTARPVNTAQPKTIVNSCITHSEKGNPQMDLQDQGVIDSGCSRHMTGNMSYLTDYEEIDGGYVAFGGNPKGGKITGKGIIKTGNLNIENVYFVRELKFNLFSVSQMCDRKNNVLFNDTECIVLSPNFKLTDESHVLLKVPRKNNMYSVDLKNIVPKGGLTCLFTKATSDESKHWHRRLGHINFKTMNKLVKGNLVRGVDIPPARTEGQSLGAIQEWFISLRAWGTICSPLVSSGFSVEVAFRRNSCFRQKILMVVDLLKGKAKGRSPTLASQLLSRGYTPSYGYMWAMRIATIKCEDADNDRNSDDERTESDEDKSIDLNKANDEEEDQGYESVHTPNDYVPIPDETRDVDDEEYVRINKELYDDLNVDMKDAEPADEGKEDEEITNVEKVQQEIPKIQSSLLLTVSVFVIPEPTVLSLIPEITTEAPATTISPFITQFIPLSQQSTRILTPSTTEATTSTPIVPKSETLLLSILESLLATVKSEVPTAVKECLRTSLGEFIKEHSIPADVIEVLKQQLKPQKSVADIRKIKMEHAAK
ncbi:ribonuclease H-like domain-containing protein [Tanacetum coccineum]